MEIRILGRDLKVSEIGFGCMGMSHAYGTVSTQKEAEELIEKAIDEGCTFFDTAEIYGTTEDPHHNTISVAVCIPFFLYCLLPFIGRALSGYTTLFNLIPTILTNVQASVKVPLIYQIGNCVFRQIPLVMVMYTVMAIALLPFIYKSFRRYGNK